MLFASLRRLALGFPLSLVWTIFIQICVLGQTSSTKTISRRAQQLVFQKAQHNQSAGKRELKLTRCRQQ
jgi:hypothetical protein